MPSFTHATIDEYFRDITSVSGLEKLSPEEQKKFSSQLKEQLQLSVTHALLRALSEVDRQELFARLPALKTGDDAVSWIGALIEKVPDAENRAFEALEKYKADFLSNYATQLY